MSEVTVVNVPCMTPAQVARNHALRDWARTQPELDIPTTHVIHAGMYHRTCLIPKGVMVTGSLIKIDTVMTFHGDAWIYTGEIFERYTGYRVLAAAAGRAQVVVANEDTHVTMSFPTEHTTVTECEQQFTDEWEILGSNRKV